MLKLYLKVLKDSFKFRGRSSRKEFWTFFFINLFISIILYLGVEFISPKWIFGLISLLFWLLTLLPSVSVAIRRLQDSGKSGWLYLLFLVPFIGQIVVLIFLIEKGSVTENKYGEVSEN